MSQEASWNSILAAAIRGEQVSSQVSVDFLKFARAQGVLPLLHYSLRKSDALWKWREELEQELLRQTAYELMLQSEIKLVLDSLQSAGIHSLLIKGTPLAYLIYPHPALRSRVDTDLLILPEQREQVAQILPQLSFERAFGIEGEFISNQDLYIKKNDRGVEFAFDCHWKISNRPVISDLVTFQELNDRAIYIQELNARAPSLVDSLLIACLHRVAHHPEEQRLIWLYDIHLLLTHMDQMQLQEFARLASAKKVRAVCLQEVKAAKERFHTTVNENIIQMLEKQSEYEPSSVLLESQSRKIDVMRVDLKSVRGSQKIQLLIQHLFPSSDYISKKYSLRHKILAPIFYAYRIVRGGVKSFRRM